MKISNLLIACILVFGMACATNSGEHGHDHGEGTHEHDDHGHNHDGANGHSHDQEEFDTSDGTSTGVDDDSLTPREDVVEVTVPAKKGVEYKLFLNQYGKLEYEWSTANAIHSDFHGEPTDYEQTKYFESYSIGKVNTMKGMATMPFAGSHGWYWKNETDQDVVVMLKTKGTYRVIGLKQ